MNNNKKPKELQFDEEVAKKLFGPDNKFIKIIENEIGAKLGVRGSSVFISGDDFQTDMAECALNEIQKMISAGYPLYAQDVEHAVKILKSNSKADVSSILRDVVYVSVRGKAISPRGQGQKIYIDAIRKYDIVFAIGPAGTGKTYLAMAMAVAALERREIKRIVLTRPAVEAGENLGFLPGDLLEKINPYLRPLYDALYDMMDFNNVQELISRSIIEVAPLAFMRGRTLSSSFIILDEAQNTTPEQMKMFLTRIGFNSKAVITGDITQIDLPERVSSGLVEAQRILRDIKGIKFSYFDETDVVRHPLVQDIIKAYDKYEKRSKLKFPDERNLRTPDNDELENQEKKGEKKSENNSTEKETKEKGKSE